jgi:hypothetical protein
MQDKNAKLKNMKVFMKLIICAAAVVLAGVATAEDKVIARSAQYAVILRTDGDTAEALVCKKSDAGYEELGGGEDVIATIAKCVPEGDALALAEVYLKADIEKQGGVSAAQAKMDAAIKEYGDTWLSPLARRAYTELGIKIP